MAQESSLNTAINASQAVRMLVGRNAHVIVQEGKFQGQRGVVVTGIVSGAEIAAAEVCIRFLNKPARLTLPLTAVREVALPPVRETLVSRFIHQLGQLIPAPRR